MRYFPIFTDFGGARVLVVGGGAEAASKARLLLKTEARIEIVAERLEPDLDGLVSHGAVAWAGVAFEESLLEGVVAVFSAAGEALDTLVSEAARRRGLPVNVVDRPELSSFIVPAIVDRDPLVVAIGTEGAGPVLAQGVRAEIERLLPDRLGELALAAKGLRELIARALPRGSARRGFWRSFFFGPVRDAFLADDRERFRDTLARELDGQARPKAGHVSLVGYGPGDPELLTLKAHRALQEADVIVHDARTPSRLLDYARRDATRIVLQDRAERAGILVAEAREGRAVVCLAAGRGDFSAEADRLPAETIHFDIVPGVGAAQVETGRVIELAPRRARRAAS